MPDYRGSKERQSWVFPIPYLLYRGETVRVDRQSVRTVFYEGQRAEVDMSFAAAPPVKSDDNEARAGMPDLDPTFEAGLSWKYDLWEGDAGNQRLRLVLPARAVFASDFRGVDWAGWVAAPGLKLDSGITRAEQWKLGAIFSLQWASSHNNAYFYAVAPEYASPQRPAWMASGGYGGSTLLLSATRRIDKWWLGAFARYDNLQGATFVSSPLVTARNNWWGGVALSRVFLQSEQRVLRDD